MIKVRIYLYTDEHSPHLVFLGNRTQLSQGREHEIEKSSWLICQVWPEIEIW